MVVVVASYRQNVHAYPSGGGDYEVATVNLGPTAGLTVASALLVDYVLTVAVSISSAAQYAASVIDAFQGHEVEVAVVAVVLLTAMNLRGSASRARRSPSRRTCSWWPSSAWPRGASASTSSVTLARPARSSTSSRRRAIEHGITGLAGAFLLLRAFSSGCAALTGVEAISNGVPAFRSPRAGTPRRPCCCSARISVTMLVSIIVLAKVTGSATPRTPCSCAGREAAWRRPASGWPTSYPDGLTYVQDPVIGQLAKSVFANCR